jgi:pentatricopeptide repeat protein
MKSLLILCYIAIATGLRIQSISFKHALSLYAVTEPTKKSSDNYYYIDDSLKNQISSTSLSSGPIGTTRKYNPTKRLMRTGGVSSYTDNKKVDTNNRDSVIDILDLSKQRNASPDDIVAACRKCQSNGNNMRRMSLKEYNIVIKALGDRGYLNSCDDILSIMLENNIKPSVVTYSTLISRAASWQKIQKAETYFKKIIIV